MKMRIFLLFSLLLFVFTLYSQVPKQGKIPHTEVNKTALKKISKENKNQFRKNYKVAVRAAKKNDWIVRKVYPDGKIMQLRKLDSFGNPVYLTTHASAGATTTNTNQLWLGGGLGLDLSGSSSALSGRLGIWDGGGVRTTHRELTGRVTQQDNNASTIDHATHVAGIMIGTGLNANAQGMAYKASLKAWNWDNDNSEMSTAAANGLLVSNHSYGLGSIGWVYNSERPGTTKWEWYGNTSISTFEDYQFGYYDESAQEYDKIAVNAPDYLIVIAAGNNRGSSGPGSGQTYYLGSSNRTSTVARRDQNGYDLISSTGVAKNVLTVGAIHPLINGYSSASQVQNSSFGNWGPTDDGRIKPDIMGDGVDVFSSIATADNQYARYSGTSMASPNVSGSVFLLQELYQKTYNSFMRSSTLKGLVIHTANDAGATGPDYAFGWGVLNASAAAQVIQSNSKTSLLQEKVLSQGKTDTIRIIASGNGPLKATIAWIDPEATPLTINSSVVNNRAAMLINDLDLKIADGSEVKYPFVLDPAHPSMAATTGDNKVDNVEQVNVTNPVAGKTYYVIIDHKGALKNSSQAYSLIVTGVGGSPYCASAPSSDQDTKIDLVKFGSINNASTEGCQSYTDFTSVSTEVVAGTETPMPISITPGTCGNSVAKAIAVFIDWNNDGDFTDSNEKAALSGVIVGASVFTSTIAVPPGLIANSSTRMRIVCVETTSPSDISACGSYGKGETEDYTLRIVSPSIDVQPVAILSPDSSTCGNTSIKVIVKIRNNGTSTVRNIPVTVKVLNTKLIGTLTGTLSDSIYTNQEKSLLLDGSISQIAGNSYSFQVHTELSNDQIGSNNSMETIVIIRPETPEPTANAYACGINNSSLFATGDGLPLWYTSHDAAIPFATGNKLITTSLPADSTYYVAVNDLSGSVGPKSKSIFGGGGYGAGYQPMPLITTKIPLVLDSARLFIGHSGKLIFTVENENDSIISSTTVEVKATRTTEVEGDADDDSNDIGKMFPLNLAIPTPGNYKIRMEYLEDASVFRSNTSVTGFPFSIDNAISLTGALYDGDTVTNSYYYLYDIKVKSVGCPSKRIAVKAVKGNQIEPVIEAIGSTTVCDTPVKLQFSGDINLSFQWKKDGADIPGATASTYTATESGVYTLIVANSECTSAASNAITLNIIKLAKPSVSQNDGTLTSSSSVGNQWYFNGEPITGANGKSYKATTSGYYRVKVFDQACSIDSDSIEVYLTPPVENGAWLYPNPTADLVNVKYRAKEDPSSVIVNVYNVLGVKIINGQLTREFRDIYSGKVSTSHLPSGVYVVKVEAEGKCWTERLIKD